MLYPTGTINVLSDTASQAAESAGVLVTEPQKIPKSKEESMSESAISMSFIKKNDDNVITIPTNKKKICFFLKLPTKPYPVFIPTTEINKELPNEERKFI